MNSGPLAQGSVRYGLAHLDSVTVGFRGSHGAAVVAAGCSPPGATGSPGKFSGVSTRQPAFTVMLMMSVVAAALAGMLYAGRLESGRYQWGTGYERSVIAAVILVGTGHRPGQRDRLAVRVSAHRHDQQRPYPRGPRRQQRQMMVGLIIVVAVALARRK